MERLILTGDGSHSLHNSLYNQNYHSVSGALGESKHIYINLGLIPLLESLHCVRIFEMGFGTGLNAFLAWKAAEEFQKEIFYTGVEANPITMAEASLLNYEDFAGHSGFMKLHESSWFSDHHLSEFYHFRKESLTLQDYVATSLFDLIFYDAFDPKAQPELWTEEIFVKIAAQLQPGGVLVTYSSKGTTKRALKAAGFSIEKHKGPGKKWHVIKAVKL